MKTATLEKKRVLILGGGLSGLAAADKLLDNDRKDKNTWRKFSFKELIYILIVAELKKFGLKHEQLQQLWSSFFKEPEKYENRKVGEFEINKGIGEIAIGLYIVIGSLSNYTMTGHLSSDIATGLKQPTALEKSPETSPDV